MVEFSAEKQSGLLGTFFIGWSLIENTLEVAISKELHISPYESSILTSGMQFKSRCKILRALLCRDANNNAAVDILNKIENMPERNVFAHGNISYTENHIVFHKRSTGKVLKIIEFKYTREEFSNLVVDLTETCEAFRSFLHIKDEDVDVFFKEAMIESQRLAMSP